MNVSLVKLWFVKVCWTFARLQRRVCFSQWWRPLWLSCYIASTTEDGWGKNQRGWLCNQAFGRGAHSRYTKRGISLFVGLEYVSFHHSFLLDVFLLLKLPNLHLLSIFYQLYPVKSSFSAHAFFSLERAAAPYFGIKVQKSSTNSLSN